MRIRYFIVSALLVATVSVGVADDASLKNPDLDVVAEAPIAKPDKDRSAPRRFQREDGPRGGTVQYQTMLLQILDEPEAREKIGLDPDVYQEIVTVLQAIDKQVADKQKSLGYLQATQAKLIVDGAAEADVMAAVDAVWQVRAEIAKFQTAKLLKVRALLTKEQVEKLGQVRSEVFRARRMEQLREGGAERPAREGRPKRVRAPQDGVGARD